MASLVDTRSFLNFVALSGVLAAWGCGGHPLAGEQIEGTFSSLSSAEEPAADSLPPECLQAPGSISPPCVTPPEPMDPPDIYPLPGMGDDDLEMIAAELSAAIDTHPVEGAFTLTLANADGVIYSHSRGDSAPTTRYDSASTAKMVTSAVILSLTERVGRFSLDSRPQDHIWWWTDDSSDPRAQITLRELLAFTSGMQPPPPSDDEVCVYVGQANFQNCVRKIHDGELGELQEYVYGPHHMQIAGLMAVNAGGFDSWADLFEDFKTRTGLFATGAYEVPSATNPLLAGGMRWTSEEYIEFLDALRYRNLLSPSLFDQMTRDHTPSDSVFIRYSPALSGLHEQWHYGLGLWRECPALPYESNCDELGRVSSPGKYGAYPFIDFGGDFVGLLARGDASSVESVGVYRDLSPLIEELVLAAANAE